MTSIYVLLSEPGTEPVVAGWCRLRPHGTNPVDWDCPRCGAPADRWCRTASGRQTYELHIARREAAISFVERHGIR